MDLHYKGHKIKLGKDMSKEETILAKEVYPSIMWVEKPEVKKSRKKKSEN